LKLKDFLVLLVKGKCWELVKF